MNSTEHCGMLPAGPRELVQCHDPALQNWVTRMEGGVMRGLQDACAHALQDVRVEGTLKPSEIEEIIDRFVPLLRSTLSNATLIGLDSATNHDKENDTDWLDSSILASIGTHLDLNRGHMPPCDPSTIQPDLDSSRVPASGQFDTAPDKISPPLSQYGTAPARSASCSSALDDFCRMISSGNEACQPMDKGNSSLLSIQNFLTLAKGDGGRNADTKPFQSMKIAMASVRNGEVQNFRSVNEFLSFADDAALSSQERERFVDSAKPEPPKPKTLTTATSFQNLKQLLAKVDLDETPLTSQERALYVDMAGTDLESMSSLASMPPATKPTEMSEVDVEGQVEREELPAAQSFESVACLFFDIVEFSKVCAAQSSAEVGRWLLGIHEVVEEHMEQQKVQIVEIRGDCYICLTGTNHVAGDGGGDKVSRMLAFACGVQRDLQRKHSTPVRIGVATGACTVGYIRANNSSVNVCAYGDIVNLAARMEQHGQQGRVLMTSTAAADLAREKDTLKDGAVLPIRTITLKGNRLCATVWYDCATQAFVADHDDNPPSSVLISRARSNSYPPSSPDCPGHRDSPKFLGQLQSNKPEAPSPLPLAVSNAAKAGAVVFGKGAWWGRLAAAVWQWWRRRGSLCFLAFLLLRALVHLQQSRRGRRHRAA